MILSVIIITHNQKNLFCRCIESVLSQVLPFDYEIVVSDDASTDGTWEVIQGYVKNYPSIVKAFQCNSDDCHPDMVSERAGYNRINGLKHAKGNYLVHLDGDDMLLGDSCLSLQVQTLESHPECSICCQRYKVVCRSSADYEPLDARIFNEKETLSVDEFISVFPYIHNSACCVRRSIVDAGSLTGDKYDDVDITFTYIGHGRVALLNYCGFAYSNTCDGTASDFQKEGQEICWLSCISSSIIAPQCTGSLLRASIDKILHVVNVELTGVELSQDIKGYLSKQSAFIYYCANNITAKKTRMRLRILWLYLHFMKWAGLYSDISMKILYLLAISSKIPSSTNFSRCI